VLKTDPRVDQLPCLDNSYSLSPEQLSHFRQDGHLLLRNVITPAEISTYRSLLVEAVNQHDKEQQSMEKSVKGQSQGWQYVNNLWRLDPVARRFTMSPRLGKLAADLLGVDQVRLFCDQSYFKAPGGGNTPWHQDAYFIPLDTSEIVTLWIALSDVSPEMAPMTFATGSHKRGYLGTSTPMDKSMDEFEQSMLEQGLQLTNYGSLAAGDITCHAGWTHHSSRMNTSGQKREALVIVYYADGARVLMPKLSADALPQEQFASVIRRHNLSTCFPGLESGDLAATSVNPIVYSR